MDSNLMEKGFYITHKSHFPLAKTHQDVHQTVHQVGAAHEEIIQ